MTSSEQLRAAFSTGLTRPLEWRREQLGGLVRLLREDAGTLTDAMAADLGKPELEGWLTDVAAVRHDIEGILRHVGSWAAPRPVRVPWRLWPSRAEIMPEPLGAVLVIGPWNYPVRCVVLPLAFALAAGNTAAVKPSELAPATSAALAKLLPAYLDERAVRVAEGGPKVAEDLLRQRWDHIFFTGSAKVGRLVMAAAARYVTPVTLELGGKNPAIVDHGVDVEVVARRIIWAKFLNAGQTCVAPDYVLVDRRIEEWGLQNCGREHNLVHLRIVKGVHGLRCIFPFRAIDGFTEFADIALIFKAGRAHYVSDQIVFT